MEIGMILIQMDGNSKLSIILKLHIYTGRRAEGPSLTNINSIRMSVCLDVCLLAISSGGNRDGGMYRIPIDVEFTPLGPNLYFKSVRPTVRTPVAENRTVVEENYQKSTFFRGFRKN